MFLLIMPKIEKYAVIWSSEMRHHKYLHVDEEDKKMGERNVTHQ